MWWLLVILYFPIHKWPLGHCLVPEALRCPRNLIVYPTLTISNFVWQDVVLYSGKIIILELPTIIGFAETNTTSLAKY